MKSQLEQLQTMEQLMPLIRETLSAGHSVRFAPRGISMLPLLREGRDEVLLSPLPDKLKKYDLPLYQRRDGSYVLHRVVREGESYTCMGDNQFKAEPGLNYEQMIGLVTAVYRDGAELKVESIGYKLYCRLWHYSRFPRRCFRALRRRLRRLGGKR